jgi:hypothetical protein
LLAFGFDAPLQAGEAILVVGLVQDQAPRFHEAQVFERRDQARGEGGEAAPR